MSGRKCPGAHCPGCSNGGALAAAVALVVIGIVVHAIWRTLIEIAWITALTALGIGGGVAAVLGLGYAALRVRAGVASRRAAPKAVVPGEVIGGTDAAGPAPVEPPRRDGRPLSQQERPNRRHHASPPKEDR